MLVKFQQNGIRYALLGAPSSLAQEAKRVARILRPDRLRGPQEITINYDQDMRLIPTHVHRPKMRIRIRKATHARRTIHRV